MFSIRGWVALFIALSGAQTTAQEIAGLNQPDPKKETAVPASNELVTFDQHRTFPTEPPARRYSNDLNRALGTPFRFFRPYRLLRGHEKGLWSVARYNLK